MKTEAIIQFRRVAPVVNVAATYKHAPVYESAVFTPSFCHVLGGDNKTPSSGRSNRRFGCLIATVFVALLNVGDFAMAQRMESFVQPYGIAVDSKGNIYVSDAHAIRKITPDGTVTAFAGSIANTGRVDGDGSTARFHQIRDLTCDQSDNIYVTDLQNGSIRKVTPNASVITITGLERGGTGNLDGPVETASLSTPRGIAVDGVGNIFFTQRRTIRKITPEGVVTTIAGTPELTVEEYYTKKPIDGPVGTARFKELKGIAVDQEGTIYVADEAVIRKVTAEGTVTTLAGHGSKVSEDGNGRAAGFKEPQDLVIDSSGNLYVSDASTIRKIDRKGVVTTFAGNLKKIGSEDGPRGTASLYETRGLAMDKAGHLYVVDNSSGRKIRKISPAGDVTTIPQKWENVPDERYSKP